MITALPPGMPEQVAWAAVRGVVLASLLAAVAPAVGRAVRHRTWLWVVLLAPLFTPSLIVGFTYGGYCTVSPGGGLLYTALIGMRLLSLAVVVQLLLPPPALGASARHCARLLPGRLPGAWLHGPLRNGCVVGAVVFLMAFQEFELASLCGVPTWTVYLMDLQVGAMGPADALTAVLLPVGVELLGLGVLGALLLAARRGRAESEREPPGGLGAGGVAALATAFVLVVPMLVLAPGLADLGAQLHLMTEVGHSAIFAAAAAACAGMLVWGCPPWLLATLALPGLLGGLLLGLSVHGLFQTAVLAPLRDTPVPLILGWTLALLPIGLLLRLAEAHLVPSAPVHAARLLARATDQGMRRRGRDVWFGLAGRFRAAGIAVLCCLAFFEVIVGDLLQPSNMPTAAPLLYNMMHYGQSPGLAAMVLLMTGAAALLASCVVGGARMWARAGWHAV